MITLFLTLAVRKWKKLGDGARPEPADSQGPYQHRASIAVIFVLALFHKEMIGGRHRGVMILLYGKE